MKILNLLSSGETGGIEVLCKNIFLNSKADNRMCFLFSEGKIFNIVKQHNSEKILSLKSCKKNIFKITNKITEYCQKEKIDIIIVHHGGILCNLIYILLKNKNPNIKFIRYLHGCFDKYSFGNSSNLIKNLIVKKCMQKAINISDHLIFVSKAVEKTFKENFEIDASKTSVIYNGIDDIFYKNTHLKHQSNDKIKLIFVGRLAKVKGVNLLIEALSKLEKNKYELTIVGEGTERKNLEILAQDLNINENVFFKGRQENVIDWLDKADIFVYPSIWEEAFGISVVEAMSRGCIPVTFKKGGLVEIIQDKSNGFLVEDINSNALANTIKRIEVSEGLIKNAIDTSKKFSIENTIENLEILCKTLTRKSAKIG